MLPWLLLIGGHLAREQIRCRILSLGRRALLRIVGAEVPPDVDVVGVQDLRLLLFDVFRKLGHATLDEARGCFRFRITN